MSLKYFLILLFTLFLSACANTPQTNKTIESNSTENLPHWIGNPNQSVRYGTIGISSKHKTKKLQRKLALIKARASLSEMIKVNVSSEVELKEKSSSEGYQSSISSSSKQSSSNMIQKAYIKDEFIDSNGNLYIWLVI